MLELQLLAGTVSICRMDPATTVADMGRGAPLWAAVRTTTELSLMVPEGAEPEGAKVDAGWRVLRVVQVHDLSVTGVTARLTGPLADAAIPVFVLATFDTDHLLIQAHRLKEAVSRLEAAGCAVRS